ncbi:hypothetical protein [Aureimonas populi]|uniref:Stress-induced protein n=1 Tax=Aureimonas populi TaxID=1701758 RepID=A0ABW5CMR1_9HYPH|nr:hypothetical protein [Aureimonas populi]
MSSSKSSSESLHRDAGSGQFTTKAKVARDPAGTTTEKRGGGSTNDTHRSAETGRFVDEKTAKRSPGKTIKDS